MNSRWNGLRNGLRRGFASLLVVAGPTPTWRFVRRPDSITALRGDMVAVGNDLKRVARREMAIERRTG